jgi:hypothetical protein
MMENAAVGSGPLRIAAEASANASAGLRDAPPGAPLASDADPSKGLARSATDRVTIQFSGEGGVEGRLRVALRGPTVQATIVSSDPETARRMQSEIGVLHRALADQGFAEARIAIQGARSSGAMDTRQDAREGSRTREETKDTPHRNDDGRETQDGNTRRRPQGRRQER